MSTLSNSNLGRPVSGEPISPRVPPASEPESAPASREIREV